MNTLVNMSLAGSAVLILWLLAAGVLKDRLPAPWHYRILKLSLFFFLIPVVRLVPAAARLLAPLAPAPALPAATAPGPLPTVAAIPAATSPQFSSPALSPAPQPEPFTLSPEALRALAAVWAVGAAAVLLYKGYVYLRLRRRVLRLNRPVTQPETKVVFWSCKRRLGIRRPVDLKENPLACSPFVTGLSQPVVVIPTIPLSAEELQYLFLHELTHIKAGDLWVRFASIAALAIHWFNPLAYLLCRQIRTVSEQSCDERVVCPMSKPERYAYGNVIMKLAANMAAGSGDWAAAMSARESLERRLIRVLRTEKLKGGKRLAALALAAAILTCGTAAALGAKKPLPVSEKAGTPETARPISTDSDARSETFLSQLREYFNAPEDTPVLFGSKDLIISRGGTLLPDGDPDSYQMINDIIYKQFLTKDGRYMVEYRVGNKDSLDYPNLLEELTPDGDYPKNSKGESYGSSAISQYVGYMPDLEFLAEYPEENRPAGYIRQTERNSAVPNLPEEECPHTFSIPLYDFEGNVIGEYQRECQGHIDHVGLNLSVEDMKAILALRAATNEEALAIVQAGGLENMEAAEAALEAVRNGTAPKPAPETEVIPEPTPEAASQSPDDSSAEAVLARVRKEWGFPADAPVLSGDRNLILSRGGTLLPDNEENSYTRYGENLCKVFLTKDGQYRPEFLVNNPSFLKEAAQKNLDQLVNGEYPKNSRGESYGADWFRDYVGYGPDLISAQGENGVNGYIRRSNEPGREFLDAGDTQGYQDWIRANPGPYPTPLYDSEGNTIGIFMIVGSDDSLDGVITPGMTVEQAKAAVAAAIERG